LSRISQFLAVPQIAGIDFAKTHANPESRSWRDCFTPEIKKIFKARYGEVLIQMGYEDNLDW